MLLTPHLKVIRTRNLRHSVSLEMHFPIHMTSSVRVSKEERNGAIFSFIAPSSGELWVPILAAHSNGAYGKGRHFSGFQMLVVT